MNGRSDPGPVGGAALGGPDVVVDGFRTLTAGLAAAAPTGRHEPEDRRSEPGHQRVPVTLLTGFLGSGKTTVLRHVLAGDHGLKVTVLVNDVGSLNIDGQLLGEATGSVGRLDLTNGCACCQLSSEMADSLITAIDGDPIPDAVIVEASGAADPVSMATTIEVSPRLRLDGIVCVVDAERWIEQLGYPTLGRIARRQVETAHLVLLTKVDLVTGDRIRVVTESISRIAPGRQVIPVTNGKADPGVVMGAATLGASLRPGPEPHQLSVVTETVPIEGPLGLEALRTWLEAGRHGLLRAKGWLRGDDDRLFELQVVGRRWTLEPSSAEHRPALVLIAQDDAAIRVAATAIRATAVTAVCEPDRQPTPGPGN